MLAVDDEEATVDTGGQRHEAVFGAVLDAHDTAKSSAGESLEGAPGTSGWECIDEQVGQRGILGINCRLRVDCDCVLEVAFASFFV